MYNDILVAVDLNDETSAKKTVDVAVACCRTFGARLHLLAVVPDFGMSIVSQFFPDDYAQKAVDGAAASLAAFKDATIPDDIEAHDIVANGTVYDEILATAKNIDADLIVLGANRPDLKNYLLGPNASRVVRHSSRSVLVVRD
jgi:nucleotide-binding universal stress UspA family protein